MLHRDLGLAPNYIKSFTDETKLIGLATLVSTELNLDIIQNFKIDQQWRRQRTNS